MTPTPRTSASPAILLVDDDPDARLLVRDALEMNEDVGEVCEVSTGEEALDFLYQRGVHETAPRPGLIYMDIEMPGIGGHATVNRIRRDPRLLDIPIVMMSGLNDDEQKRIAAANGANSYTVKPTDPLTLAVNVRKATAYWTCIHRRPDSETSDE